MLHYLSGPMTGLPKFNYPYFNAVAQQLREDGFEIINPAENFEGRTDLPREEYMAADIKHLMRCDAIILLDGWEASRGARLELEIAQELGLEIYRLTGDQYGYVLKTFIPQIDIREYQEAEALVHGPRNADYGHPLDDFTKTALIWSAILGIEVTPEEVALCMVGVKLSREVNKPKRDNLVDAHGYLMTYRMVKDEKARRGDSPESIHL